MHTGIGDPSRAREGRHRVPDAGGGTASTSPTGVLAAVVAAVRANAGLLHDIAAHVRVEGGVEVGRADIADALVCLHLVGVVAKGPGGRAHRDRGRSRNCRCRRRPWSGPGRGSAGGA